MLDWALRYIRLGWPVLPLRGKLPQTEHGSKDATLNIDQARDWWGRWPQANVGLATGLRFFVVDVDIKSGGEDTWDMLRAQHGAMPATIEQVTGTGGRHILYALPNFTVLNSQGKVGPGIDIRGSGGYIVASPSIHPETKRRYEWDGMEEIEQQTIAPAPAWLLASLQQAEQRASRAGLTLPEKIPEGGRNDLLFRAAAKLRRIGWDEDMIYASIVVINQTRCAPPLQDGELRTISVSAARYPPDPRASQWMNRGVAVAAAAGAGGAPRPAVDAVVVTNDGEVALGQADIEAAVEAAIAANDRPAAAELAKNVAQLGVLVQFLIKTKLSLAFGEKFGQDFDRVIRKHETDQRAAAKVVQIRRHLDPSDAPPGGDEAAPESGGLDLLNFPDTDSGNGERLVAMFREDIRYCIEMNAWLVWDGRRWAKDDPQAITQRGKDMARVLYEQARNREEHRKKWARTSESQASIAAMLKRAATEDGVPVFAAELDQHAYLLNCLNGVVDLRTGDLLPHDRGYLITKMCHATYDPKATCPRFLRFLHRAMGDNPDSELTAKTTRLVGFLQRAMGYSLTSDVSEKCVFVFWGAKGNNGKTTLLTAMRMLMSEYSAQISIDTLMTSRGQDATMRADLADLRGARFVTTSEVEKEHRLSEGKLKYITAGMGKVKSCRKYENPIEFDATHKIFMDCNHRPAVRGTDDAIWRRLKLVSFDVSITEKDPEFDKKLLEKLVAEASGILTWAVRGCQWWLKDGLMEPAEVLHANEEWREHDDPLKDFMEDCCETFDLDRSSRLEEEYFVRSADLSECYMWWCKREHERFPLGRQAFRERVLAKGYSESRSRRDAADKQLRSMEGLRIKNEVTTQMVSDGGGRGAWAD